MYVMMVAASGGYKTTLVEPYGRISHGKLASPLRSINLSIMFLSKLVYHWLQL